MGTSRLLLGAALLLLLACSAEAWGKKKTATTEEGPKLGPPPKTPLEIVRDPIDFVGRIVYTKIGGVNRILRFITGKQISEYAMVMILKIACNLLYVSTVLVGFIFLPKNVMLIIGVLTSFIGPLIALLIIGIGLGLIAFFIYAPCISMNIICVSIFLSGPMGQGILKSFGLDSDGDGDVDLIDIARGIARKLPGFMGGQEAKYKTKEIQTAAGPRKVYDHGAKDKLRRRMRDTSGQSAMSGYLDDLCTRMNDAINYDKKHEDLLKRIEFLEQTLNLVHPKESEEVYQYFKHDLVRTDENMRELPFMPHK